MPFDIAIAPPRLSPLAEALDRRGIVPVPQALLSAHKQAQLRRFGPNFWFRHQGALVAALLLPFAGLAATGSATGSVAGLSPTLPGWLGFGWMCLLPLLFLSGVLRMRAGSHWEERWVPAGSLARLGVPEPIAALARELQQDVPGATLILGELIEDRAVLDPYLLLARGGERVCLGVWDGSEIVARAA